MEKFKIRVNSPEHSKEIQELCFANGITWLLSKDAVSYKLMPFLYIKENEITYGQNKKGFYESENKEVTLEELKQYFRAVNFKKDFSMDEKSQLEVFNPQEHYDNVNGSLFKIATELELNHWEFDIFKRLVRCRKKNQFEQDLQKIKDTVDIYLKELNSGS